MALMTKGMPRDLAEHAKSVKALMVMHLKESMK